MPIETIVDFRDKAAGLVARFNAFVASIPLLETPEFRADHICYKCGSSKAFGQIRTILEQRSVCVFSHLTYIAGRRIAYIKLVDPIESTLGSIWFVELSNQKPDGSQSGEFEHIEFYPNSFVLYREYMVRLRNLGKMSDRPHHPTFDIPLQGGGETRFERMPLIRTIANEIKN